MVATAKKEGLTVKDYKVSELKAFMDEGNPRVMKPQQRQALNAALQEFGMVEWVILNVRNNTVVGGHQRIVSAEQLGLTELPVVEIDVDPAEANSLNLALNKIKGEWDYAKLADMMPSISADLLVATGFTQFDVDAIASITANEAILHEEGTREELKGNIADATRERLTMQKIQFGRFSKRFTLTEFAEWIEGLKASVGDDKSPEALGMALARRLRISFQEETENGSAD